MHVVLKFACSLLLILLSTFCSAAQVPFADESPTKSILREAIFRYMFVGYNYGPSVKVYCVQPDRLLPDNFLQRFPETKIRLVWAFQCDNSGPMGSVREKKSGVRGIRMTIMNITWLSGTEAEAKVEAFSDGIAANDNTLYLKLKDNKWIVVKDRVDGVS